MPTLSINPQIFLTEAARRYPNCWRAIDEVRSHAQFHFPAHIFLSSVMENGILRALLGAEKFSLHDVNCLTGLAAWRATQGVYRIDSNLYDELVEMDVGQLPAEVFFRLPEWCIYIELQNEFWHGVFAYIDFKSNPEQFLSLLLVRDGDYGNLQPISFPLEGSLKDAILQHKDFINKHVVAKTGRESNYDAKSSYQHMTRIVSLVLYICSTNAELSGVPIRPKSVKTKHGPRWFPPAKQTVWEVGYRTGPALGRALRLVKEHSEQSGVTVRPHIRRAHWHHFWTGTKETRQLILKWMPPIFVNVEKPEDLVTTIRPVLSDPE